MRNIIFKNVSGETMPAHAVFMATTPIEYGGKLVIQGDKYDGTAGVTFYINGPTAVASDKYGFASDERLNTVLFSDTDTPAMDEEYGPESGEWWMSSTGEGYLVQSTETANQPAGTVLFASRGGGGSTTCFCDSYWYILWASPLTTGGTFTLTIHHTYPDPEDAEATITDDYDVELDYNVNGPELYDALVAVGPWDSDPDNYKIGAKGYRLVVDNSSNTLSFRMTLPVGESVSAEVTATSLTGVIPWVVCENWRPIEAALIDGGVEGNV